jgi:pimeloyl-ACP methyl ester carboxylesterase
MFAGAIASPPCAAQPADGSGRSVVVLVPGISFVPELGKPIWGSLLSGDDFEARWTGLIGYLENHGFPFGGTIRPQGANVVLPDGLDATGVEGDPRHARLFELDFSASAETDGLAFKALELAACLRSLRTYCGIESVCLVAHSAGGLVSRVYLQNALPGVPYAGEVDRLITIGTPHLGSATAHHLGELLGTRATSLAHDSDLLRRLNQTLALPEEVHFASIVVRGFRADVRGTTSAYDEHLDPRFLATLPLDFVEGGDEVVHVRSQNLALALTARMYESSTGRPVLFVSARVSDPSPGDIDPRGGRVHAAEVQDPSVLERVLQLLDSDKGLWLGLEADRLEKWVDAGSRAIAESIVERETLSKLLTHDVTAVELTMFELTSRDDGTYGYDFEGVAHSKNRFLRFRHRDTLIGGTLRVRYDQFGRPLDCRHEVTRREDE